MRSSVFRIVLVTAMLAWHSVWAESLPSTSAGRSEIILGVLATWSPEDCRRRWEPTAEYLSQAISEARFVVRPLTYEQVLPAVERGDIDFLVTNPALYAACEQTYHATRIATRIGYNRNRPAKTYAAVVVCRAARIDMESLADLRGKVLMAVHPWSFGGWLMAQRELHHLGIHSERDLASVEFAGRQDAVVEAVMGGQVDAGTLCAYDLERMIQDGKVKSSDLRVLRSGSQIDLGSNTDRSTRFYPQWAFSKIRHTSDELAERVAEALLEMSPSSEAARSADTAGWTIPLAYEPVHECLRELRFGPYTHYGEVTLVAAIRTYWPAFLLIVIGWTATGIILMLNRQLRESEALRHEAERFAISGRLAASVAHEINNPMSGIVNCLHLVRATMAADHPSGRYLAAAEKEANRITRIVRQMLALHRCRPEKASRFELAAAIEDVVLMLQPLAQEQNVRIENQIGDGEMPVCLPEESLRQVLFSLLTNAIEASPAGKVVLVDAHQYDSHFEILITDYGVGIPEELQGCVFEPLFSTKAESGAGLGLGLSISRGIAESLGGTIHFESRVGRGTRFFIRLPLCSEPPRPGCYQDASQSRLPAGVSLSRACGRVRTTWHRTLRLPIGLENHG